MLTEKRARNEMSKFVRVNTLQGMFLFLSDIALYLVFIAGVLYLPEIWMKIIASVLAGIKISNLVTIAHDAAHNSLTRSRRLNWFVAVISLLPGLTNYRLWAYIHHQQHHPMTNLVFPASIPADNFTPYSRQEFNNLPVFLRIKEKFYRCPNMVGFGIYFLCERWLAMMLFPRKHMDHNVYWSAWCHFILITGYTIVYAILLFNAPVYSNTGGITAFMLGLVVPFFVFQTLLGFTVYVQHTHERVPWFRNAERNTDLAKANRRQELVSVQLAFPAWLVPFMQMHHAYDHGAHHVCPSIPCYQLGPAQERLNELLGDKAIVQEFSLTWLINTMQKCKLYDYDNHRWLDFDGRPTTGTTLSSPLVDYAIAA